MRGHVVSGDNAPAWAIVAGIVAFVVGVVGVAIVANRFGKKAGNEPASVADLAWDDTAFQVRG